MSRCLEDQRSCVTSNGGTYDMNIKIKQEPAEHLESMNCSSNQTSNLEHVKVENNKTYESKGMEAKSESTPLRCSKPTSRDTSVFQL
jgi:hypothetical protein